MFSKSCEYGIKAMIHISHQSQKGNRVSLKDIAKAIDSPVAFTAKILQSLAKDSLIISIKGSAGGYQLINEQSNEITLHTVVSSIDGGQLFSKCGLGLQKCNEERPCPVHFQYKAIRDDLNEMFKSITVKDLGAELDFGMTFLKT